MYIYSMSRVGQLQEMLGNLGQRVRSFDDQYAQRVREAVMVPNPQGQTLSTLRNTVGSVVGSPLTHGLGEIVGEPRMIDRMAQLGMPAASATVRYGLPAAGLTAAGMQLAQLTNNMSSQGEVSSQHIPALNDMLAKGDINAAQYKIMKDGTDEQLAELFS